MVADSNNGKILAEVRTISTSIGELKADSKEAHRQRSKIFEKLDKIIEHGCPAGKANSGVIATHGKVIGNLVVWLGVLTLFCTIVAVILFGPLEVLRLL